MDAALSRSRSLQRTLKELDTADLYPAEQGQTGKIRF